jgi:hypothetical protein
MSSFVMSRGLMRSDNSLFTLQDFLTPRFQPVGEQTLDCPPRSQKLGALKFDAVVFN